MNERRWRGIGGRGRLEEKQGHFLIRILWEREGERRKKRQRSDWAGSAGCGYGDD